MRFRPPISRAKKLSAYFAAFLWHIGGINRLSAYFAGMIHPFISRPDGG